MRCAMTCMRGAMTFDEAACNGAYASDPQAKAEAGKGARVRKPYPLMFLVCVTVAVGAAGCAQPSVKPPTVKMDVLAKQLGISTAELELALRAGYTTEIEGSKTLVCSHGEQTGSMIPVLHCEDPARLQSDLQARQQFIDYLRDRVSQSGSRPGVGGPP
jgi:hypothetical protein